MDSLPLLFLGCLAGLSLPMLWSRRRNKSTRLSRKLSAGDDLLSTLDPGAVVQHAGQDLIVTMAGRLAAAGPWERLLFLDGKDCRFLMLIAARGATERIWLLAPTPEPLAIPRGTQSAPEHQQLAGLRFTQAARYLSAVTIVGRGEESLRLDVYRGPGARRLLLFRMGSAERDQSLWGEVVEESSLAVLPATSAGTPQAQR